MNSRGEVVGINTAVIMGAQGICFAVASNTASFVLSELVKHGRVRRGFVGIAAQTVQIPRRLQLAANSGASGAMVTVVEPGSPADLAGIRSSDILVALDGQATEGVDDLLRRLHAQTIGRPVAVSLLREGRRVDVSVTPRERGG